MASEAVMPEPESAPLDEMAAAAVEPVATYIALKLQVAQLERAADEAKDEAVEMLQAKSAKVGTSWAFPGVGSVLVVKGRESSRLDRAKLARAGVSAKVLDDCTVTTTGSPSVRIAAELDGDYEDEMPKGWTRSKA